MIPKPTPAYYSYSYDMMPVTGCTCILSKSTLTESPSDVETTELERPIRELANYKIVDAALAVYTTYYTSVASAYKSLEDGANIIDYNQSVMSKSLYFSLINRPPSSRLISREECSLHILCLALTNYK